MKKTYVALFIALALLFITACSNGSNSAANISSQPNNSFDLIHSDLLNILPFQCDVTITEVGGKVSVSICEECSKMSRDVIDSMGYGVLLAKEYCDSSLDDYELSVYIFDLSSSSIPLLWKSNFSDYGTLIDTRSGETNVTIMQSEEDMFSFFPGLLSKINASKLDQHDLEIYSEVMYELDSRPKDSEEMIITELAQKYGMTHQQLKLFVLDVMEKVNSHSGSFESVTPITYPSLTESTFFDSFQSPPDSVYSSPASENCLDGSFYSVIGTVREHSSIESSGIDLNYFILDTVNGPVLFVDLYSHTISLNHEDTESLNHEDTESLVEAGSDYTFPPVDSYVKVYGVYSGLSKKFEMPMFIYGLPKWIEK